LTTKMDPDLRKLMDEEQRLAEQQLASANKFNDELRTMVERFGALGQAALVEQIAKLVEDQDDGENDAAGIACLIRDTWTSGAWS
jgi:hypothetical protein